MFTAWGGTVTGKALRRSRERKRSERKKKSDPLLRRGRGKEILTMQQPNAKCGPTIPPRSKWWGPSGVHRNSNSEKKTEVRAASVGSRLGTPKGLQHKAVCGSIAHTWIRFVNQGCPGILYSHMSSPYLMLDLFVIYLYFLSITFVILIL